MISISERHMIKGFLCVESLPQTAKAASSHVAAETIPAGVASEAQASLCCPDPGPAGVSGPTEGSDGVVVPGTVPPHLLLGLPALLLHKANWPGNLFPPLLCHSLMLSFCHSCGRYLFMHLLWPRHLSKARDTSMRKWTMIWL